MIRRLEAHSQRRRCDHKSSGYTDMREGPQAKECLQPLEARKDEAMNSFSPETSKRNKPCLQPEL